MGFRLDVLVEEWIVANNAVRKNDMTSGHHCFPPQRISGGSPDVFANKRNVIRQGDDVGSHTCGIASHGAITDIKPGRRTVFINGIPPTRLGDKMDESTPCSSIVITASSNVFFGE